MRKFFNEYFYYSAKELRPLYYLSALLLLSIIVRISINNRFQENLIVNPEIIKKNQDFIESLKIQEIAEIQKTHKSSVIDFEPFKFDPNTISISRLRKFGFNDRILSNLDKYRKAGGRFYKPSDLKNIYGMTDDKFYEVEKWISIEFVSIVNESLPEKNDSLVVGDSIAVLDLNRLLYKDLIRLANGNRKMTARIINYRDLLGGFYSIDQLWEVYDMTDSLFNNIFNAVEVDSLQIEALSLNGADYSSLLRHPYLNKANVNLLLKYREFKNSNIERIEFVNSKIFPDSLLRKMLPYLRN